MRRSQHTDDEILALLDEARSGVSVELICQTAHVSLRTFYRWRKRLEGVTPKGLKHIADLEAENMRLKRQLAFAEGHQAAAAHMVVVRKQSTFRSARADYGLSAGPGVFTGRFASLRSGR